MRGAWLGLLCAACAAEGGVNSWRGRIVSGELDLGDPEVAALILESADGSSHFCSGTLVSPRVVLTAGHCLAEAGSATRFEVGFGTDARQPPEYQPVTWQEVADHMTAPDLRFDAPAGGDDIGLILLDAPSALPPRPMSASPPRDGEAIRAVGFGRTGRFTADSGVKRETPADVTNVLDDLFFFGSWDGNTCLGDSGGPVYQTVDRVEVLVGVSSFGDDTCTRTTGATRVDVYLFDLLYPWIAAHDPDAPPPPDRPPPPSEGGCEVAARAPGACPGPLLAQALALAWLLAVAGRLASRRRRCHVRRY